MEKIKTFTTEELKEELSRREKENIRKPSELEEKNFKNLINLCGDYIEKLHREAS